MRRRWNALPELQSIQDGPRRGFQKVSNLISDEKSPTCN
jgi:hypothetical protein